MALCHPIQRKDIMKKVVDPKTGRKITVFNKYELNGALYCPECKRQFKENDIKFLNENNSMRCKKCGSILVK